VRHNASRQPFDRDTLYVSVYKALGHRKDAGNAASALTATIIAKVRTKASGAVIERNLIVTTALEVLANFDTVAAVQYGAYHPL
jgi:transcriptional regulator NrdR family protein